MAWFASISDIPWRKALVAAPALAERGRDLLARLGGRTPIDASLTPIAPGTFEASNEAIAALEVRYRTLESHAKYADEELKASFEVVRALADQHSELVRVVDALIARTRMLLGAIIALAVACAGLALLLFLR
jgi:hypothetical protein